MSNLPVVQDQEPDNPYLFTEISSPKRRKWLTAFAQTGMIAGAEQLSGVNHVNHYHWLDDPTYARAFAKAQQVAADGSEDEVVRRGRHGIDEPIFYKGRRVDSIRKYSDILLMCHINAVKPDKYHRNPIADQSSAPVTINITNYNQTVSVDAKPSTTQVDSQSADAVKIPKW